MITRSVDRMLSGRRKIFNSINFILDTALITLSGYAAYVIREYLQKMGLFGLKPEVSLRNWYILVILSVFLLPLLFRINRLYPSSRLKKFERIVSDIFKSLVELVVFFILLSFLMGEFLVNRSLMILFAIYIFPILCLKEMLVKRIFLYRIRKSGDFKNCIVIGTKDDVETILEKLKKDNLGIRVEGAVYAFRSEADLREHDYFPMLGTVDDLSSILEGRNTELVIVVSHPGFEKDLEKVIFACEDRGVEVWLKYPLFERQIAKLDSGYLGDIPMVIFSSLPTYGWPLFVKTAFDFTFAILIFPVFCILYVLIGIGVKLSSSGSILFKQKRAGLYGRPFVFLKFRTMYEDAEQRKDELRRFNIMKGPVFKVKDDPRIFPFGKFLRKTSLDELPQLINILKGEMSFIGPRPLASMEAKQVKGWQRRRLRMKPGLSCLWQVEGRSEIREFDDWAKLDLEYIDNWSLGLDVKIFLKTIWVVLTGYGAE